MTMERKGFLVHPDTRRSGKLHHRLSVYHLCSHRYIHTWASFREIPPVCLLWRNEFRLMKVEENLTLQGLSLYHWGSQRRRRETRSRESGENSGRPGEGETKIALRHSLNIYHGSNTWFTASPRISPTLNKTPSSCPGMTLTDRRAKTSLCLLYRRVWQGGLQTEMG